METVAGRGMLFGVVWCIVFTVLFSGCISCSSPPPPPAPDHLSISAWLWRMNEPPQPMPDGMVYAHLYVDAGAIREQDAIVRWPLPQPLPAYRAVVLVFRSEAAGLPSRAAIAPLVQAYTEQAAALPGKVWGLQIDYDCPTRLLTGYAAWLKALRQALPGGCKLSITSLLDWYTAADTSDMGELLEQVDEHTPQFYDLGRNETEIAASLGGPPETAAKAWDERFSRHHKPYRIGVATFGRLSKLVTRGGHAKRFYLHASPADYILSPRTHILDAATSAAGERHVRFTHAGEEHLMVIPTADVLARALAVSRRMSGWNQGVIIFRHPGLRETLALSPQEVQEVVVSNMTAATGPGARQGEEQESERGQEWGLEQRDGQCASLQCVDLYLKPPERFASSPATVTISASSPWLYTMPLAQHAPTPARQTGPASLEVTVPPFLGQPRIPVLRVFSRNKHMTFRLQPGLAAS